MPNHLASNELLFTNLPFTSRRPIRRGEETETIMDLNYVFLRQQVERSRADRARNDAAREAHEKLARTYELAIEQKSGGRIMFSWHRGANGLSASRTPSASS